MFGVYGGVGLVYGGWGFPVGISYMDFLCWISSVGFPMLDLEGSGIRDLGAGLLKKSGLRHVEPWVNISYWISLVPRGPSPKWRGC